MYKITINGQSQKVELPCYVKYVDKCESYMTCSEAEAQAVICQVDEEQAYCDISSKSYRHDGFPLATIEEAE